MIFVNYGGGGYWFFDHSSWNGLTVADLVFPWFMWIMGVSMALGNLKSSSSASRASLLLSAFRRGATLIGIGLFLNSGGMDAVEHWRLPGVLQYFGFSYIVVSFIIIQVPILKSLQLDLETQPISSATLYRTRCSGSPLFSYPLFTSLSHGVCQCQDAPPVTLAPVASLTTGSTSIAPEDHTATSMLCCLVKTTFTMGLPVATCTAVYFMIPKASLELSTPLSSCGWA
jgi:hypothetical protein